MDKWGKGGDLLGDGAVEKWDGVWSGEMSWIVAYFVAKMSGFKGFNFAVSV